MGEEAASAADAPGDTAGVFLALNVTSPQLTLTKYLNCAKCPLYSISHPCMGQENKSSQCRVRNFSYMTTLFTVKIVKPSGELNIVMSSLLKGALPKDLSPIQNYSSIYFLKFGVGKLWPLGQLTHPSGHEKREGSRG